MRGGKPSALGMLHLKAQDADDIALTLTVL
jgi:hypothetical protein